MRRLPATRLSVEVRLIITLEEQVLLVPECSVDCPVHLEPAGLRLPADLLGLGEPASEAAVRVAADEAALAANASDLRLSHVTHHRIYGEEQLALFFHIPTWDELPHPRRGTWPGAGQPQPRWYPLDALPGELCDLDREVLAHWVGGRSYSEAGWSPLRPTPSGGLSPLQDALQDALRLG